MQRNETISWRLQAEYERFLTERTCIAGRRAEAGRAGPGRAGPGVERGRLRESAIEMWTRGEERRGKNAPSRTSPRRSRHRPECRRGCRGSRSGRARGTCNQINCATIFNRPCAQSPQSLTGDMLLSDCILYTDYSIIVYAYEFQSLSYFWIMKKSLPLLTSCILQRHC